MENTQREPRVTDDSAAEQSEESFARETAAVVATARLLANPRRIRRN